MRSMQGEKVGLLLMGQACVSRDTFIRGQRYSILPALSSNGIIALDIFEGSVNKERFISMIQTQVVCGGSLDALNSGMLTTVA